MWIYHLLDYVFFSLHLLIIGFNLVGWLWKKTLRLHLIVILATAASWLILGIWYGMGYCFLTDWHWDIKAKLGQGNLPSSFITYFVKHILGVGVSVQLIDFLTAAGFIVAAFISLYRNIKLRRLH